MQKSWPHTLAIGALLGVAFLLGQWTRPAPILEAQGGRGPINAPPPSQPEPPTSSTGTASAPVVYTEDAGQGGGANGFIMTTGSYGVGTSVLYVLDTHSKQLAVYEARGGSTDQRRVVLVGARRIDLDLQIEGFNDRSEYDYKALKKVFENRGKKDVDVSTGLKPSSEGK